MSSDHFNIEGLSQEQIIASRKKNGTNTLKFKKENTFIQAFKRITKEPMKKDTMLQAPKVLSTTFFNWKELSVSIFSRVFNFLWNLIYLSICFLSLLFRSDN